MTDAQVAQIRELRRYAQAQERALESEIDSLSSEFADMFTATGPLDNAHFWPWSKI